MDKGSKIITGLVIGMGVTNCILAARKVYKLGMAYYMKRQEIVEAVEEVE